jgi:hypothetical protein
MSSPSAFSPVLAGFRRTSSPALSCAASASAATTPSSSAAPSTFGCALRAAEAAIRGAAPGTDAALLEALAATAARRAALEVIYQAAVREGKVSPIADPTEERAAKDILVQAMAMISETATNTAGAPPRKRQRTSSPPPLALPPAPSDLEIERAAAWRAAEAAKDAQTAARQLPQEAAAAVGRAEAVLGGWHAVLGELLGSGHFAEVFAAGPDAAVKVLRDSAQAAKVCKGWAAVSAVPQHPGIVRLLAMATDGSSLMMERGHADLFGALWENALPGVSRSAILRALLDVGAGLRHMHAHGVAHRDVKPENILLRREPGGAVRGMITDFDFAVAAARLPVSCMAGTPKYIAHLQDKSRLRYKNLRRAAKLRGAEEPREPTHSTFAADAFAFAVVVLEAIVLDLRWSDRTTPIPMADFLAPLDEVSRIFCPALGAALQLCLAMPCDAHQLDLERKVAQLVSKNVV